MTEHHDDVALTGTSPEGVLSDHANGTDLTSDTPFTVEEVLGMAERVERTAPICLAANLQGEWDRLLDELKTLITPSGEILDSAESAMGEETAESRALAIQDRLNELRREMQKKMWYVTFRAMISDDFATFTKRYMPKDARADRTDFLNRLICETAVSPTISMEQIKALRQKLGPQAIAALAKTAQAACIEGGLDVPKLPVSLRNLEGE